RALSCAHDRATRRNLCRNALAEAIRKSGHTQAWLARSLHVHAAQVSRWTSGQARPHQNAVLAIGKLLGIDLMTAFASAPTPSELFVSAPIIGLGQGQIDAHRFQVGQVVRAAEGHVGSVYWPGRDVATADDLSAPDLKTETNLSALSECRAFLYVQFLEI